MTVSPFISRRSFIDDFLKKQRAVASFDQDDAARKGGYIWIVGGFRAAGNRIAGYAVDYSSARLAACDAAVNFDDPRQLRCVGDIRAGDQWSMQISPDEDAVISRYWMAHEYGRDNGIREEAGVLVDLELISASQAQFRNIVLVKEVVRREAILESGGQRSTASALAALAPLPSALRDRFPDLSAESVFEKGLDLVEVFRSEKAACRAAALLFAHEPAAVNSMMNTLSDSERLVVDRVRLQNDRIEHVAVVMNAPVAEVTAIAATAGRKLHRLSQQLPAVDRDLERAIERTTSRSLSRRL